MNRQLLLSHQAPQLKETQTSWSRERKRPEPKQSSASSAETERIPTYLLHIHVQLGQDNCIERANAKIEAHLLNSMILAAEVQLQTLHLGTLPAPTQSATLPVGISHQSSYTTAEHRQATIQYCFDTALENRRPVASSSISSGQSKLPPLETSLILRHRFDLHGLPIPPLLVLPPYSLASFCPG